MNGNEPAFLSKKNHDQDKEHRTTCKNPTQNFPLGTHGVHTALLYNPGRFLIISLNKRSRSSLGFVREILDENAQSSPTETVIQQLQKHNDVRKQISRLARCPQLQSLSSYCSKSDVSKAMFVSPVCSNICAP